MRPDDLQSLTPRTAMQRFLDRRRSDDTTAPETVQSYADRLGRFVRWCEGEGILNVNDLGGRHLDDYWQFRRESLNDVSLKNEFSTIKKLLEYLVAIEAVEPDMPDKAAMLKPTLSKKQRSNDRKLGSERAEEILAYLEKFHYASRDHAMMLLLWHTACRRGDFESLDVEDFHEEDGYVEFKHRPAEGTRLKNGFDGERANALGTVLGTSVAEVLGDYIRENRIEQTDQHDRRPLFTTERGRIAKTTIQRNVYALTQPCFVGECPVEEIDPETCEALDHGYESKCPESLSPHRIRTGAITHMRESGMGVDAVSERVDATAETIRAHYDRSDERDLMEHRRTEVEKLAF